MKEKFVLHYVVTYNGDSPIKTEESFADIMADNFESAYEKAKALADDLRTSPNVMGVEMISLSATARRKEIWRSHS